MTSQKTLFTVLFSGALILTLQRVSSAQVCTSDAGCAKGTRCQPTGAGSGTGQGTSGPAGSVDATPPICPEGQPKCGAAASGTTPAGTTTATVPEMTCQPAPCEVDADCAATMVCHASLVTSCSGSGVATPACPPNQLCPPAPAPEPVTCTTTSSSSCTFKWQLPCNVDADCGNGFACAPSVSGNCGGSAGSGGSTGTSAGGASVGQDAGVASSGSAAGVGKPTSAGKAPPICTTTPSFPGYCQPKATTCTGDSDCPASWTCVAIPDVTPTSAGAPPMGGAAIGVTSVSAQGMTIPAASKVCQPPAGFGVKSGSTVGVVSGPGGPTAGTPTAGNATPRGDSSGSTGATAPTAPEGSNGAPSSSGCSVAAQADLDGSLVGFGALGLLLAIRANRRRSLR